MSEREAPREREKSRISEQPTRDTATEQHSSQISHAASDTAATLIQRCPALLLSEPLSSLRHYHVDYRKHGSKMDNTEEPQKKVFKARKTMKASDRQQLEAVHKAKEELLKPTDLKLVNGNHENGDSDISTSHNDTDYMADQKEINGIINVPLESQELPIVKLSDIKDGLRSIEHTRDLKLKLDWKVSETSVCKEKSVSGVSEVKVKTLNNQVEIQCNEKSSNNMLDTGDQRDSNDLASEEQKLVCEAELAEEKSESSISVEEEESHIILEGIHELEDDDIPEEEQVLNNAIQKSVSVTAEGQGETEEHELDNVKSVSAQEEVLEDIDKVETSGEEPQHEITEMSTDEKKEALDANEDKELSVAHNTDIVNELHSEESPEMMVAEDDCAEDKNEAEMKSVEQDAGEEAISSSMEIDLKATELSTCNIPETTTEKSVSDVQTEPGLESPDSMETDEIIPILEKLAPVAVEDEPTCFPIPDLQSEISDHFDEEKIETCNTSPSKQESNETLPSEAFLVLSDEEEPCVEAFPLVEEKAPSPPGSSNDTEEKPAEKEEQQQAKDGEKPQAEKSEHVCRKRSKSEDLDSESSKRRRFDGEELEAEIKVKITGGDDLDKKLQKVIQKMLEEKLSALQCAVFDKTLADLKTRVEKIECKKHETALRAIQAKIARLTKRFGAAKEDLKKKSEPTPPTQEPPSPGKSANDVSSGNNAAAFRNNGTVRQMLESKRNVGEVTTTPLQSSNAGQQPLPAPASLPLRTPNTTQLPVSQAPSNTSIQGRAPPDWKLIQQRINASSIAAPPNILSNQSKPSPPVTSASVMTSVLPAPNTATVVGNSQMSGSNQPMSVSLQSLPVILHVPMAMSSQSQLLQGATGTLVTNQQSGNVEFIQVQNQSTVNNLNKAPSVSLAQTKPINSPSMPSPGIQRNSPANASSMPSTLAVQAISTAHSVAQASRSSLPPIGASSIYSQAGNRTSLQMKVPQSGFNSPSSEASSASRADLQVNRPPTAESTPNKRAVESATSSGKPGSGVIDLTLDEEDLENVSQDARKNSTTGAAGNVQSPPAMSRTSQPPPQTSNMQPPVATTAPSQATIHVLPTAQTTVNVNQRPVAHSGTRVPASRVPANQQIVYTTTPLPTVTSQAAVRNTLMQSQNLRQISPQTSGVPVRMSQTTAYVVNSGMPLPSAGPQLTVHHRPQEPQRPIHPAPLPEAPLPQRLPPEATTSSAPQKPHLKLARVQSQNGIVLSWSVLEVDRNCATVDSYHLYAYHEDPTATSPSQWKKIGEVKALPLPMACTLTQFVSGSKYYFAVRAKDIYGRFGPFCDPQSTDVISTQSS